MTSLLRLADSTRLLSANPVDLSFCKEILVRQFYLPKSVNSPLIPATTSQYLSYAVQKVVFVNENGEKGDLIRVKIDSKESLALKALLRSFASGEHAAYGLTKQEHQSLCDFLNQFVLIFHKRIILDPIFQVHAQHYGQELLAQERLIEQADYLICCDAEKLSLKLRAKHALAASCGPLIVKEDLSTMPGSVCVFCVAFADPYQS